MKWIRRKGKIPPGLPSEEKFMFEEIDLTYKDGDPALMSELYEKVERYVPWVTYPDDAPGTKPFKLTGEAGQRKYEIFCGGFLYYHDIEFKNYPMDSYKKYPNGITGYPKADFEHKIYFEWFKKEGIDKVRIYINTTPKQFNPNPPPPPPPPPPESN